MSKKKKDDKPLTQAEIDARLKHAYAVTFKTPLGELVKADLERFCSYNGSTVNELEPALMNPYQTFWAEGKRRVYIRIINMSRLGERK